nr:unnamed protein product [Digitaria exilis]
MARGPWAVQKNEILARPGPARPIYNARPGPLPRHVVLAQPGMDKAQRPIWILKNPRATLYPTHMAKPSLWSPRRPSPIATHERSSLPGCHCRLSCAVTVSSLPFTVVSSLPCRCLRPSSVVAASLLLYASFASSFPSLLRPTACSSTQAWHDVPPRWAAWMTIPTYQHPPTVPALAPLLSPHLLGPSGDVRTSCHSPFPMAADAVPHPQPINLEFRASLFSIFAANSVFPHIKLASSPQSISFLLPPSPNPHPRPHNPSPRRPSSIHSQESHETVDPSTSSVSLRWTPAADLGGTTANYLPHRPDLYFHVLAPPWLQHVVAARYSTRNWEAEALLRWKSTVNDQASGCLYSWSKHTSPCNWTAVACTTTVPHGSDVIATCARVDSSSSLFASSPPKGISYWSPSPVSGDGFRTPEAPLKRVRGWRQGRGNGYGVHDEIHDNISGVSHPVSPRGILTTHSSWLYPTGNGGTAWPRRRSSRISPPNDGMASPPPRLPISPLDGRRGPPHLLHGCAPAVLHRLCRERISPFCLLQGRELAGMPGAAAMLLRLQCVVPQDLNATGFTLMTRGRDANLAC